MRRTKVTVAVATALALGIAGIPPALLSSAGAATVGQGFTVTPSDLAYILKQIKISEAHVANTTSVTGPCGALLGSGPNQLPSPLLSFGLRTVDGSCNNLIPGQETNGAADQVFPRLATPVFKDAEAVLPGFGPPGPPVSTSYANVGLTAIHQVFHSEHDRPVGEIQNLLANDTTDARGAAAFAE